MARIIIILVTFIIALAGCAPNWQAWQGTADAWKGSKVDDLIFDWGPPKSIRELADGRKVVLFQDSWLGERTRIYCVITFNSDLNGVIVSSHIKGDRYACRWLFKNKRAPK